LAAAAAALAAVRSAKRRARSAASTSSRALACEGAVSLVGGVARQLGAVQGDHADLDHAGGSAQPQGLHEEAGQGLLVADAEPRS
jgi:hypothetical protein